MLPELSCSQVLGTGVMHEGVGGSGDREASWIAQPEF